jgi:hypothetical protein
MKLEMVPVNQVGKKIMSYTTGQELTEAQLTLKLMSKYLTLGKVLLFAIEELLLLNLLL